MKRIGPSPIWTPSYVPFMSYVLLESKAQIMAQFKSTLLDLHALLQVFVISLAYLNNVWSPLNLSSSNGRPFWIFFIIDLVIGPFNGLGLGLEGAIGLGGVTSIYFHLIFQYFPIFLFSFSHYYATSSDKICLWNFLYNHVHSQYHDHENINQMLLHSLLGMEREPIGHVSWFSIKSSLLCPAILRHEINS